MLTGRETKQLNTGLPHHLNQKSSASFVVTVLVNKHLWPPQHPTGRSCPQISSKGEHWWQPTTIPRFAPLQLRRRGEQTPPLGASRSHLRPASRASASTTGRASLPSLWTTKPSCVQKILNLHQRCVWRDNKSWGEQKRGSRGSFWGRGCRGRSRPRARSTWTSSGRSWRRCTGTRPPPRCCPCGRRRAWWTRSSRTTRTRRGRSWNFKAEGWTAMFSCYQVFHHHPPPPHLHHLRLACRQTQAFPVPLY